MSKTHNCQIPGCDTGIRTRFLMCHQHWEMVPRPLQDKVNDEYHAWQEQGAGEPTIGYAWATEAALKHVTEKTSHASDD